MLDIASTTELTLDEKMSYHLALSFARPLKHTFIPALCEAIRLYDEGLDMSIEILLPEGVAYYGQPMAPASALFEDFKLRYFAENATTEASAN